MVDTADSGALDAMLVRLSEMVARRLRDHHLFARTLQIKLRYSDFSTFTRSRTLDHATQIDTELAEAARDLVSQGLDRRNRSACWASTRNRWKPTKARPTSSTKKRTAALAQDAEAVDRIRDKYGDHHRFPRLRTSSRLPRPRARESRKSSRQRASQERTSDNSRSFTLINGRKTLLS